MVPKLILASSSPRRRELLELVNLAFTVRKQEFDESTITTVEPAQKVEQLAINKAKSITIYEDEVILAADTVVSFQGRIYGKPKNSDEALTMLRSLSGNVHEVYTGVMIRSLTKEISFVERTMVEFWPLEIEEIKEYIATKDPFDKAGAYGIQSQGAVLVKNIIGDYFNVMGLPISRVVRELKQFQIVPNPTRC
ncbi:Maf family protein [Ornithinibacillus bavariensis]|uniref:dTTP/UTP pyrophosphatase n=1 Tax=Ornithinibacillus bavariensis TaxID=545502 RepID=A0A919X7G9_9BACI|nr:Maf family protein [Ornithinibacillus bavariensis]GIO25610.1 septum formation protein Maf [Ornithinibacillus bavariensis]HAM79986.1 septum formation protein Maf [Ornithinibacillus sp.]